MYSQFYHPFKSLLKVCQDLIKCGLPVILTIFNQQPQQGDYQNDQTKSQEHILFHIASISLMLIRKDEQIWDQFLQRQPGHIRFLFR